MSVIESPLLLKGPGEDEGTWVVCVDRTHNIKQVHSQPKPSNICIEDRTYG